MVDQFDELEEKTKSGKKLGMYVYILPNLVTIANLFSGFYSIIASFQHEYKVAAIAIVVASIFDQLDGRLARLTRATSKFGAELDSLCDVVSFGVAPGILMYLWSLSDFGRLGLMASFLFAACGALRLARFNVQVGVVEKNYFQGLPIPMAAGIIASAFLAFEDMGWNAKGNYGLLLITILLAFVMVSNFRYRSFKDIDLKQRLPFRYLILGVIVLFIVAIKPEVMLFVLFFGYAALGAIFGIFRWGKNRKTLPASVYAPAQVNENDLQEEED
ncbi:MAG: CDP-diacylglycerol--serine O-phosphatidyltransferase [Pseudobdellovibrio sp.]